MSDQMILEDTRSAIFSQELADGAKPSGLQTGHQIELFGLDHVRAKVSALLGKEKEQMTNVISGRSGSSSSKTASLQSFLESRLMQRLGTDGSILFQMTWAKKVTSSGRQYCQLVASARRTSENAYSSWPTPTVVQAGGTPEQFLARKSKANGGNCKTVTDLGMVAQMAAWPTVTAQDSGNVSAGFSKTLWATAKLTCGQIQNGFIAGTENTGQLNPEHCRWLMGFPRGWSKYADMETP